MSDLPEGFASRLTTPLAMIAIPEHGPAVDGGHLYITSNKWFDAAAGRVGVDPTVDPEEHHLWREAVPLRERMAQFWLRQWDYLNEAALKEGAQDEDDTIGMRNIISSQIAAFGGELTGAESVWVSDEMVGVATVTASAMPEGLSLHNDDIVARHGFLLLERPVLVRDHEGNAAWVALITWAVVHHDTEPYGVAIAGFIHLPGLDTKVAKFYPPWMVVMHPTVIDFGRIDDLGDTDARGWMCSLLLMMNQRVVARERKAAPREERRRAQRAGKPAVDDVTVITLRRLRQPDPEGHISRTLDHDHRWVVRAHWRNQWYPSEQRHRSILIDSFVKGPDDKPLVVKPRVAKLVR